MSTVSKALSKQRLTAIITHLLKPQEELLHTRFDFKVVHEQEPGCGTNGCAYGEMPAIFPDHFKIDLCRLSMLSSKEFINVCNMDDEYIFAGSGAEFLGISEDVEGVLFIPSDDYYAAWQDDPEDVLPEYAKLFSAGVVGLGCDATKQQVADNIQKYIDVFLADA